MMKRPMLVIGLSLALATWAAFLFSARQALLLSAAAAVTALLLAALSRGGRPGLRPVCVALLATAVALALHTLQEVRRVEPFLRADSQVVEFRGLVTEAWISGRSARYRVEAVFPGRDDLPAAPLSLRAYGEMDFVAGDVVGGRVLLTPKEQSDGGLRLSGETVAEGVLQGEGERLEDGYALRRRIMGLRGRFRENLYAHLHPSTADIVAAMVLGVTDEVSPEIYAALNRAGTVHLLSVSGLHLSVLTALVLGFLERLGVPRRPRSLAAIGAALAFAGLVGFSASITRSFTMTAIALAAGLGRRRGDGLSSLGFAVAVICLARPGWVLGKGFWLSAGSTLGILLYARRINDALHVRLKGKSRWYNRLVRAAVGAGAVSVAAYTVTLPLLILFNGWISLISPLANILVAPFAPVVIAGGMVCALTDATVLPVQLLAAATDVCTAAVLRVSQLLGGLPFATMAVDEGWMPIWLLLAAAVAAILALYRADRRLVATGMTLLALSFSLGTLTARIADRDTVELATIEGCDAAVLLRDGEAVVLGTPAHYEIDRLLRYLEFRGVRRVRAVAAHDCGEQVGSGLLRLAARYPVDCVIGPDDAYILGQLAQALPDVPVYSGGYASLEALGGVALSQTTPKGDLRVETADNLLLKSAAKYDILKDNGFFTIGLFPEGTLVLDGARGLEPSPVGAMLYGERRFRLAVEGRETRAV